MRDQPGDQVIADGWDWIDENQDALIDLLSGLVERPGVSGEEGTHDDPDSTVGHLWSTLEDWASPDVALHHHRIPHHDTAQSGGNAGGELPRENVYAVLGGGGRGALVSTSHTDTVPAGSHADWPGGDPFRLARGQARLLDGCRVELSVDSATSKDSSDTRTQPGNTIVRPIRDQLEGTWTRRGGDPAAVLIGRGVYDNLGSSVCLAGAMTGLAAALDGTDRSLGGDLIHGHLVGEERQQVGARNMVGWEGCDDWLGDHYPRPERFSAVVMEGSYGFVPAVGHRGLIWLRLRADGQSAHACTPEHGANAVLGMSRALSAMDTPEFEAALVSLFPDDPLLGEPTVSIGTTIAGGGVHSVDQQTGTVDADGINVVPDWCEATFDFRIPRWHGYPDPRGIRERLAELVEQYARMATEDVAFSATISPEEYCPPVALADDLRAAGTHPLVDTAASVTENLFGFRPDPILAPGATDASVIVRCTGMPAVVEYGPAGGLSHQPWEFVERDQIIDGAKAMLALAVRHLGVIDR